MVERGAARFELDATQQRAGEGELFVLEPEAVHTGMAAVPEGWAYKVLYIEPRLVHDWAERDGGAPRAPLAGWCSATSRCGRRSSVPTPRSRPSPRAIWRSTRRCCARSPRSRPHLRPGTAGARPRAGRARARSAERGVTCTSAGTSGSRWPSSPAVAGLSRFELVRRFGEQNGVTPHAFQTQPAGRPRPRAPRRRGASGRGRRRVWVRRSAAPHPRVQARGRRQPRAATPARSRPERTRQRPNDDRNIVQDRTRAPAAIM